MLNNNQKIKKIVFAFCCIGLFATIGVSSIVFGVHYLLSTESVQHNSAPVVTSFRQQYSFELDDEENVPAEIIHFDYVDNYCNKVNGLTSRIKLCSLYQNVLRDACLNLLYKYGQVIDQNVFLNGKSAVIKLSNGHFVETFSYCPSTKVSTYTQEFSNWLNDRNIPFLTVITPDKSDDSITTFPEFIPHGYSQMHSEYIEFLEKNNIAYLDSRNILLAENNDFYSGFFKTDSNWNVHASFLMAEKIAGYLNEELNIHANVEALDKSRFELKVFEDCYNQGYGAKLGNALQEDLEIYFPTEKISFTIEIPSIGTKRTDSFDKVFLRQSGLRERLSFVGGCAPLVRIENNDCNNDTRVLVIGKCFTASMNPYLACAVKYIDTIDPRYFDGSIRSYIEQTNPDIVVTCFGVPIEGDEVGFDFK